MTQKYKSLKQILPLSDAPDSPVKMFPQRLCWQNVLLYNSNVSYIVTFVTYNLTFVTCFLRREMNYICFTYDFTFRFNSHFLTHMNKKSNLWLSIILYVIVNYYTCTSIIPVTFVAPYVVFYSFFIFANVSDTTYNFWQVDEYVSHKFPY